MLKYLLQWLQEASNAGGLRLASCGSQRCLEGPEGGRTTPACSMRAGRASGAPRSGIFWVETVVAEVVLAVYGAPGQGVLILRRRVACDETVRGIYR